MIDTQEKFLARMGAIYEDNLAIAQRKNSDYGGGRDPFANFKMSEQLGISMVDAVLVRLSDKLSRIATLKDQAAQVKDESILDTLSDLANYAVILRMIFENKIELRDARNSDIASGGPESHITPILAAKGQLEASD